MVTIEQNFIVTTEVKRSKFIAHLVPKEAFDGLQNQLKAEHPKASHVVYAYRHLNEHDQTVENSSDDGEPRGAAGTPILNVLRGKELVECAVVIVRYFGGIKLGIGGMVRAYTLAAQNVVSESIFLPYYKEITFRFETTYREIQRTEYRLAQMGIVAVERHFATNVVEWDIRGSKEQIMQFRETHDI